MDGDVRRYDEPAVVLFRDYRLDERNQAEPAFSEGGRIDQAVIRLQG